MFIVAWTMRDEHGTHTDHWSAHETMQEARCHYAEVLESEPYTASITAVVESTDYDAVGV